MGVPKDIRPWLVYIEQFRYTWECMCGPMMSLFPPSCRCSILNPKIEHEEMAIHDAIVGYNKRVDYMVEGVGIHYFFAFVRPIVKLHGKLR